jgi:predicted anti-sigma-YlaC factor YlaD
MNQVPLRVSFLLSVQRALWERVSPGLRGVAVTVSSTAVSGRMIFDHVPTDDDVEDCSLVETHIIADMMPEITVTLAPVGIEPPAPRDLFSGEEWVYLRKEPH